MESFLVEQFFKFSVLSVEVLGVVILLFGIVAAIVKHHFAWLRTQDERKLKHFASFRKDLGRTMLLALEFFVAADILMLVIIEQTPTRLLELLLVVVIRTLLSATLELELTGSWPWQKNVNTKLS